MSAAALSAGNARIKDAARLRRRSERSQRRLFLADSPKAVEGALGVPGCVVEVFATAGAAERYGDLLGGAGGDIAVTLVEDRALALLCEATSPAGVVALCRPVDRPLAHLLDPGVGDPVQLVAICADVRDPGNAGTVIRCADAAGADAVVLAGHSVDLYNPKTLRAAVGSAFHLPIAIEADPAEAVRRCREAGLTVLAADGTGELDLHAGGELFASPSAWLFGNEAWGLPTELAALADHRVAIPIHGGAESLNLATAAALCLYESARHHLAQAGASLPPSRG